MVIKATLVRTTENYQRYEWSNEKGLHALYIPQLNFSQGIAPYEINLIKNFRPRLTDVSGLIAEIKQLEKVNAALQSKINRITDIMASS